MLIYIFIIFVIYLFYELTLKHWIYYYNTSSNKKQYKTIFMKYCEISYDKYKLLLPIGKKQNWKQVLAIDINKKELDVTNIIEEYAGPYKNFFNVKIPISSIIRDYKELKFVYEDTTIYMVDDILFA